tara:strand:+ start:133 stop:363 length:231 start_codon:yes stop_codon:yes gene_type:complete
MERGLSHMVFLFVPKNEGQIQFRMSDEIPGLQYHFVGHPRLFDYAHKQDIFQFEVAPSHKQRMEWLFALPSTYSNS